MPGRMTDLGQGCETRESEEDCEAEEHHGVQSDPDSVHGGV